MRPEMRIVGNVVRNEQDELLCVMLEPWGEDYWAGKGEFLTFTGAVSQDEFVELQVWDGGVSVGLADASDVTVTSNRAGIIDCGYQRPPDWGEPLNAQTSPSP